MFRRKYYERFQWVMRNYYVGCASWGSYVSIHYAPFASDLVESDGTSADFNVELCKTFKRSTQFQAGMPASSGHLVMQAYYVDVISHQISQIIDYNTTNFQLDLKCNRFAHQGVLLLPFIENERHACGIISLPHLLTDDEKNRTSCGHSHVIDNRKTHLRAVQRKGCPGCKRLMAFTQKNLTKQTYIIRRGSTIARAANIDEAFTYTIHIACHGMP